MSAFSVERITSLTGLELLEADWWRLWRRCSSATPFTSPAWLIPWWRHFAPGTLAVIALRYAGELVALAPLYLEIGALGRRILPLGIGVSDAFDLLIGPDHPDSSTRLAEALASDASWQALSFEEVPAEGAALGLPSLGCRDEIGRQSLSPMLDLADGDIGALVSKHQRRAIAQARNRLRRRSSRLLRAPRDGVLPLLDRLRALHAARWRSEGHGGVFADPRVRAFHEEATPRLQAAGLLRLAVLTIDDRPAAAYYGLCDGRRAYGYLTGFDPDFAFESPGSALIADMIEEAAAEGCEVFDFLRGQEPYKYEWGARDQPNYRRVLSR